VITRFCAICQVDDGVIREIYPALLQSDWSLLIAHFLGVDHVGHIFGVESPLMVEKLEQYNRVIEVLFPSPSFI
jgi:predicted AlkP superfamily pyrophosphatase or phosphodiesterase